MIDMTCHPARSPRTPGPDRGGNIVHGSQTAFLLDQLRQTKAEVRAVDRDQDIRLRCQNCLGRLVQSPAQMRVARQDLHQPHQAQLVHRKLACQAFSLHHGAANTLEFHSFKLFQAGHQCAAKAVAGCFTRNHEDPHHRPLDERKIPSFSAACKVFLRSSTITRPASITKPDRPAAATSATVSGPTTGMSTLRSCWRFATLTYTPLNPLRRPLGVRPAKRSVSFVPCKVSMPRH